jgi:hypothetical protein
VSIASSDKTVGGVTSGAGNKLADSLITDRLNDANGVSSNWSKKSRVALMVLCAAAKTILRSGSEIALKEPL